MVSNPKLGFDPQGRLYGSMTNEFAGIAPATGAPTPVKSPGVVLPGAFTFDEVGSVVAMHGNCGQVFFLTEDGFFISSLFRDACNTPEGRGAEVVRGKGWRNISMYQEAFCAWFGKQDDGKCRHLLGHTCANFVEVTGLDTIKRFTAGVVTLPEDPASGSAP